jgi:hypothetical protein
VCTGILIVKSDANTKRFGLAGKGQDYLEGKGINGKGKASISVVPNIHKTSFFGLSKAM